MWLIVSSLSPHYLHFLFCCVLSILALIWLVLMTFICAAVMRYLISHIRFMCEMLLISRLKSPLSCLFFPILFSGYCRSIGPRVVSIVSGGCNQSFSEIFFVAFELLYWCVKLLLLLLLLLLEFFTSALADGFSLVSKWQQVSSNLQDSSQDSVLSLLLLLLFPLLFLFQLYISYVFIVFYSFHSMRYYKVYSNIQRSIFYFTGDDI